MRLGVLINSKQLEKYHLNYSFIRFLWFFLVFYRKEDYDTVISSIERGDAVTPIHPLSLRFPISDFLYE